MATCSNFCATAPSMAGTSSIKASALLRLSGINLEECWEARSKKDKLFLFGNYEAFRERLSQSTKAIVPDAFARKGLLPDGSPVPNLKTAMLPYVNAFWPAYVVQTNPHIGNSCLQ